MYRIKEQKTGYFTIYKNEEKMYINDIFNSTWYINGLFKSEKECKKYLKLLEKYETRELVNEIYNIK